jgi:hypothetical protein
MNWLKKLFSPTPRTNMYGIRYDDPDYVEKTLFRDGLVAFEKTVKHFEDVGTDPEKIKKVREIHEEWLETVPSKIKGHNRTCI